MATDNSRLSRELESRTVMERPKAWAPPALLPDPTPEEGFVFRWVRVSTLNEMDPTNLSGKFREGWEPVKADTQPHMQILGSTEGRFKGCLEVGGLLLCKAPKEFMDQRAAYYQQQADNQMSSVDNNFMQQSDPRMPLFADRKTSVTFGKGGRN